MKNHLRKLNRDNDNMLKKKTNQDFNNQNPNIDDPNQVENLSKEDIEDIKSTQLEFRLKNTNSINGEEKDYYLET